MIKSVLICVNLCLKIIKKTLDNKHMIVLYSYQTKYTIKLKHENAEKDRENDRSQKK